MVRGQMARQASYSLRVLALFLPPTTIIASTRRASSWASAWRFCVAGQMVHRASRSGILSFKRNRIFSHSAGEKVVCDTARALSMGGSPSASWVLPIM